MCRMLAELLGANKETLSAEIHHLEAASGLPGCDVRLSAEIIGKVHMKTRELGLDPEDTTGRELYRAQMNLVGLHDQFLVKRLKINPDGDMSKVLAKIRKAALSTDLPKTTWALKASAAKKLLKAQPPKQLMKALGYKSLDSMLKREKINELFIGIQIVESDTWTAQFINRYKSLTCMDFESRPLDVVIPDAKKWSKLSDQYIARRRHIIMHVRELGVVGILPAGLHYRPGLTLTVLSQLLQHMNEVRLYSSFYKLNQMRQDFGAILADSLLHDEQNHLEMAHKKVHWRVAQRHFGRSNNHPESLEPHVMAEDLAWRKGEEALYKLEPALHFWHDQDYVGVMHDDRPLSFNLLDAALNYVNGLAYEHRLYGHMQEAIINELYARYLGQPSLENQVLNSLDSEPSALELLAMRSRRYA